MPYYRFSLYQSPLKPLLQTYPAASAPLQSTILTSALPATQSATGHFNIPQGVPAKKDTLRTKDNANSFVATPSGLNNNATMAILSTMMAAPPNATNKMTFIVSTFSNDARLAGIKTLSHQPSTAYHASLAPLSSSSSFHSLRSTRSSWPTTGLNSSL